MNGFLEYVAEMSESDKRQLLSLIHNLLSHRLKLKYVGGRNINHWNTEIREFEERLFGLIVDDSPGLKSHLIDLNQVYTRLVRIRPFVGEVRKAYPKAKFPNDCPFTLEHVVGQRVWNEMKKRS